MIARNADDWRACAAWSSRAKAARGSRNAVLAWQPDRARSVRRLGLDQRIGQ